MSFSGLTSHQRGKVAKLSHYSIASRKFADLSIVISKQTTQEQLASIRQRIRDECFSPLSDGPIAQKKLSRNATALDREAERLARFIESVEAQPYTEEDEV